MKRGRYNKNRTPLTQEIVDDIIRHYTVLGESVKQIAKNFNVSDRLLFPMLKNYKRKLKSEIWKEQFESFRKQ